MTEHFHLNLIGGHDWIVKTAQLLPLGITDQHLHFFFGMILIALIYALIRPLIYWMILLKWERVLTYLVSGLFVLFLLVSYEMYQGITGSGNVEFRDVANGALAMIFFGSFIAVIYLVELFFSYIKQLKKQKAKSA
ncbi:hypothetical protein [Pontibacillus sp. HMF3514]|uniref:hypothetical protein n=1 Tax=Pontibacillus sp. HMF3514 TaxID=2692425 RepID=UPI0013201F14|nr:hypothetical protein [Pontibacillus sp. HMF3514]QHE51994.1 hypothetical protein GS400_08105 [Pontibacillus sp. HMF3514]